MGGDILSTDADRQGDSLRLFAYGYLANFWLDISTRDYEDEEEANSILRLQDSLIEEFERTLGGHLDETALNDFKSYVKKFKVGISR
jgi:hypothetical protein